MPVEVQQGFQRRLKYPESRGFRFCKGWKALGYESFKEYGEKELKLGNFVYRLAEAAEIKHCGNSAMLTPNV